jgi:hydroxyacylglutathione hydrolase
MLKIEKFVFNPFQENTFVVYSEDKKCIIVDAGCYSQEERQVIENFVFDNELEVQVLLNTHCHVDHVFGNAYFVDKYKVELAAHKDEEFLNNSATDHAITFGLSFKDVAKITRFIEDNDKIKIGESILEVLHVPGHSPGGVAFYAKEEGFLIAGDILFKNSIGRTDLPGGSYETLIDGIKNKLMTLPDETIVYPGHGDETTIKIEKESNPFLT